MHGYGRKIPGWGWVFVTTTAKGLCQIHLGRDGCKRWPTFAGKKALDQIERYLKGDSEKIRLKIDLQKGTPFQKKVWKTLQKIPFGKVRSYRWVAKNIGKPRALRAVGQACGANPLPLVIPCHRVISNNGEIGGFSAGLRWKQKLLKLEKRSSPGFAGALTVFCIDFKIRKRLGSSSRRN